MNFWNWLKSLFQSQPEEQRATWLDVAQKELGIKEKRGGENPRIIEYHATTTLKADEDEVSWCSSFVNWCFKQVGIAGTNNAAARSWLKWGSELKTPKEGCVVVFWRVAPSSWQGHVAFFKAIDGEKVIVLGGNQGDAVTVAAYPLSQVLGYRWPTPQTQTTQLNTLFPKQEWAEHALRLVKESKLVKTKVSDSWFTNKPENWVHLLAAMAKFESGFDASQVYVENFKNSFGELVQSTGLFQLSYESARGYGFKGITTKDLKDPLKNIEVAVKILERWVANDGVISSPANKGGARYWSVLRSTGKLDEVIKTYKQSV